MPPEPFLTEEHSKQTFNRTGVNEVSLRWRLENPKRETITTHYFQVFGVR